MRCTASPRRLAFQRLRRPRQRVRGWTVVLLGMLAAGGTGCGVVGDPIAPEDIGIEAKVRAQQRAEEALRETPESQPAAPDGESETVLPPLQPIGTQ